MNKNVYFIANSRMPSQKAYGIQVAKMCEAFIEAGQSVVLVVPSRGAKGSMREFYGLRVEVPIVYLPALSFKSYEKAGFALMGVSFMFSYLIFLWTKFLKGERFVLYTIDADRYSSSFLPLVPAPLFSEMHGGKPASLAQRLLFWRVRGIIAINDIIVRELKAAFPASKTRYIAEPNGVDEAAFAPQERAPARAELNVPSGPTVLYAGRFFDWKGLEILPRAAALTPQVRWQVVGGTREEFAALINAALPDNLFFAGSRPHSEMPRWIAAADAALVLGTKRDEQSYRWTSPMKLFEYMAAGRPVVAADTPALRQILSGNEAFLYEPDNAQSMADAVLRAAAGGAEAQERVRAAAQAARGRSWSARAARVIHFMDSILHDTHLS